ncbi:MAG TPA: hypothetical protein VGM64_06015 [Lacunisphaera sp.]|jgi:hypothetical protein
MKQFDQQWRKLTALARQANDPRDAAMPYGFATRVTAQPVAASFSLSSVAFGYFAVRGLMVAAAFGLAAIAIDYSTYVTSTQTDAVVAADMVGELLDPS